MIERLYIKADCRLAHTQQIHLPLPRGAFFCAVRAQTLAPEERSFAQKSGRAEKLGSAAIVLSGIFMLLLWRGRFLRRNRFFLTMSSMFLPP